jgi:hypothetical protein
MTHTSSDLYYQMFCIILHVKWVHCHHGMARPRVADRDGLQIWTVAANILNTQLQTADGGYPFQLGGWVGGLTTLSHKTRCLLRNTTHSLGSGCILRHNLSISKWRMDIREIGLGVTDRQMRPLPCGSRGFKFMY